MDIDQLRARYRGTTASNYEDRRRNSAKWHREQDAVADFVERIAEDVENPLVLDIPVGTGRFFDLYERNSLRAVGVDVSEDMLGEARAKLDDGQTDITLQQGDIMNLAEVDVDPDAVVSIRFMNWLDTPAVEDALSNIEATDPEHVVVGIRVRRTLRHRLGGLVRRTYHAVTGSGESKTTIHDEQQILTYFAECGFTIEDRELVDEGPFGDKYIYWLARDR